MRIEIGNNEAGQRIDKFLRKWLKDVPLSAIYKNIRKGDIKVNGKKIKEKYSLNLGDIVETREIVSENKKDKKFIRVEDFNKIKITYEDENMLLVEKWPGILVHSDKRQGEPTLTDYVLTYLCDKGDYIPENEITFTPASCNRLDRNTSGIVIFGKNYEALKLLNEMVRERRIKKYYQALVLGKIKDGVYEEHNLDVVLQTAPTTDASSNQNNQSSTNEDTQNNSNDSQNNTDPRSNNNGSSPNQDQGQNPGIENPNNDSSNPDSDLFNDLDDFFNNLIP